ncbi:MAG: response regulator [Lachnospiraceae bacterium]|nr:response regulator [Lachnospiraceae bacterium]
MADWIVIVDDDMTNLKVAGHILSKNNKRVTALKSGEALLAFIRDNRPNLILLDIRMPGMDGFETFKRLRSLEKELNIEEIPVIFLTADEETATESRGFEAGVSDYIRKPFEPEILIKRINNILGKQEVIHHFQDEASRDKLTGFLNKATLNEKLKLMCRKIEGFLMMADLDSFKLVNDIYGHDMGDKVLISFAEILKSVLDEDATIGRFGGDEFVVFAPSYKTEEDINNFTIKINELLYSKAKELMGSDFEVPLGLSVGAIYVSGPDADYLDLLSLADKALYSVKQKDKHGYSIYKEQMGEADKDSHSIGLKELSMILSERNIPNSALTLDKENFISVYRFLMRYLIRYNRNASKLLFNLLPLTEESIEHYQICDKFFEFVKEHLRKSDLLMRYRKNKVFVFLTEIKEFAVNQVVSGIINAWQNEYGNKLIIQYEVEEINAGSSLVNYGDTIWAAVADDDPVNLKLVERMLNKSGINVSLLNSGRELLDFVKENRPDLILLDYRMDGLDGFDTMVKLRDDRSGTSEIPVIFMTANEDVSCEARAISLGAMDIIRKPFVPETLVFKVKQIVELERLRKLRYMEFEKAAKEPLR